jgi:hypothetical protein
MGSLEQIINVIFGGQITVDQIVTILVGAFAVVKSITEWKAKVKLIQAEKQQTATDKDLAKQRQELQQTKQGLAYLCNIMTTAYLSSNTIDDTTKKRIASYCTQAEKVASIDLTSTTKDLIEVINKHVPGSSLNEKKQDIEANVQLTEELLDSAIQGTTDAIDNLKL